MSLRKFTTSFWLLPIIGFVSRCVPLNKAPVDADKQQLAIVPAMAP